MMLGCTDPIYWPKPPLPWGIELVPHPIVVQSSRRFKPNRAVVLLLVMMINYILVRTFRRRKKTFKQETGLPGSRTRASYMKRLLHSGQVQSKDYVLEQVATNVKMQTIIYFPMKKMIKKNSWTNLLQFFLPFVRKTFKQETDLAGVEPGLPT